MSARAKGNVGGPGRPGKTTGTAIPVRRATPIAPFASSDKEDVADILVFDPRDVGGAHGWGTL